MAVKLGHDAGLGDRIVRVKSCQRAEMAFSRIDSVGRYEEVPNTGVRNLCSMERSRGRFSGCRSGKSQWAPVAEGSNRSFGADGRSLGSRSTPQPGIRARSWSAVSVSGGFSDV